jgi:hypothetical protein
VQIGALRSSHECRVGFFAHVHRDVFYFLHGLISPSVFTTQMEPGGNRSPIGSCSAGGGGPVSGLTKKEGKVSRRNFPQRSGKRRGFVRHSSAGPISRFIGTWPQSRSTTCVESVFSACGNLIRESGFWVCSVLILRGLICALRICALI